ncbi:hypothetical protein AVEN_212947-1, partial [Araneus ventricosus]
FEDEPTVEETQAVLLKGEYDPKEFSERQPVHVEPRTKYHRTMSFILNWMCSFICFLLLMLVIAFSVDYDEILLLRYLSFLR